MLATYESCSFGINELLKNSTDSYHVLGPEELHYNNSSNNLKVFKNTSELLQASSYGTIGTVLFSYENIQHQLEEILEGPTSNESVEWFVATLLQNLDKQLELEDIDKLAAVLDPGCYVTTT